ncbi:MAG: site-specific DNA-methyltransferase [Alphaproteobacteria bacterium]|nr:site-specific DNA-methyltransferase [Alphaproteobacteria bacterium]
MTSPPYWGHRRYAAGGLGEEPGLGDYLDGLLAVLAEVRRVLRPTGSLWLNLGDSYRQKALQGVPWRVAIALMDQQRWILRNDVIWHKVKGGPDNARDKLRPMHEHLFHFVKQRKGYFYDDDAIRSPPGETRVEEGGVISATGVRGVRYRRQIRRSNALSGEEKAAAEAALDATLADLAAGRIGDFRMVIRKQQRATHSDAEAVSGRARELAERGFYVLPYHPKGAKLGDVWDIVPEDTHRRTVHFAPYPEALCRVPILATCPPGGVVLDPFCGTGTTVRVAQALGRRGLGVDLAEAYLALARG